MGVRQVNLFRFKCDSCHQDTGEIYADSLDQALKYNLKSSGWVVFPEGKCFCPKCWGMYSVVQLFLENREPVIIRHGQDCTDDEVWNDSDRISIPPSADPFALAVEDVEEQDART